jgi:hypothetical protein
MHLKSLRTRATAEVIVMKTYEEEMKKKLEAGEGPRRVEKEFTPGVKNVFNLPGTSLPKYLQTPEYATPAVPAKATEPTVKMPAVLEGKDLTPNYTQRMLESIKNGDYPGAMYNEMMHNEKNGYLGLGYANSHIFNYDDPYRGELDRQREAIENRDPFSYDYREDDLYKSILAQKEKEADKAYNDGYAQLSRQFDGDIPVNMINKLITTKGEIIDQADSYIPQLRQLAYGMYQDEGNKMLTDYNLTQQAAAEDYDRWRSDRDFIISGIENEYSRDKYDKEFDYQKNTDERNFNEDVRRYDSDNALRREEFDYQKELNDKNLSLAREDAVLNLAIKLMDSGIYSPDSAVAISAKIINGIYG